MQLIVFLKWNNARNRTVIYFKVIKWALLEKTKELQKKQVKQEDFINSVRCMFVVFVLLVCISVIASDLTMCCALNGIVDKWVYEIYICQYNEKRIQRVNLIWPKEVMLFGRAPSPSASHLGEQIGNWFRTFAASAQTGWQMCGLRDSFHDLPFLLLVIIRAADVAWSASIHLLFL